MKHRLALTTSAAALILTVASAHADSSSFTGFYAPETWTITGAGIGGSSAVFASDGSALIMTSADGGMGADTDVTHVMAADGIWSFDWAFQDRIGEEGFEFAYYLINGTPVELQDTTFPTHPRTGSISLFLHAGDVVGWRVDSLDGFFGPGYLTITDFRAPVSAPAALALLGLATVPRVRRRR